MSAKLKKVLRDLQSAACCEDIFGNLTGKKDICLREKYHKLSKICHPDLYVNTTNFSLAEEAFKLLGGFLEQAENKLTNGTYGDKKSDLTEVIIITKHNKYTLGKFFKSGNIADIYHGKDQTNKDILIKIVADLKNNDLISNEAKTLDFIKNDSPVKDLDVTKLHIPDFYNSFQLDDKRKINILGRNDGFYSLKDIRKGFPNGIDPRDATWMFNRLMGAILAIHQAKRIHGAITPDHFLVNPETHNGILVDYCYSVIVGEPLKAINNTYKYFYPPEVFEKKPTKYGLDLCMAANTILYIMGGYIDYENRESLYPKNIPKPIIDLFKSCFLGYNHRMNSVWELYQDFGKIITSLWGPRKFRKFEFPKEEVIV